MDKELLIKELILEIGDDSKIPLKELEQKISNALSLYSVSKSKVTLPATGNGETTKYLFSEFLKEKISQGKSKRTLEQYTIAIDKLYTYVQKDVHLCTKQDLVSYLNNYKYASGPVPLKTNTVANRYLQISAFFSWLFANGYIAKNPFDTMNRPRIEVPVKSIITKGEFERLVITCEKKFSGIRQARLLAIMTFLLETGARVNETVNIQLKDLDLNSNSVIITHGKGGKQRKVFFGEKTEIRLNEYLMLRSKKQSNDYLFTSLNVMEEKIAVSTVEKEIREIGKISNLSKLHPHLFRATFATNMVTNGVPITTVSALMGHASPKTLTNYLAISDFDMQQAVRSTY